jgi:hypothetical protein
MFLTGKILDPVTLSFVMFMKDLLVVPGEQRFVDIGG